MASPLKPLVSSTETTNQIFIIGDSENQRLVKKYRGDQPTQRYATELSRLTYWRNSGYPVPRVISETIEAEQPPYLVLEYIDGQDLGSYLRDQSIQLSIKLETLAAIFQANASRHQRVLDDQDSELLHHDINTGNILINDNGFYFIDFEARMKVPDQKDSLIDLIGIEVAKLIRWSARDLGRAHLADVVGLMLAAYKSPAIANGIIHRVYGRALQPLHRWKDRRKKKNHPEEVSKYDIADTLFKLIAQ